MVTDVVEVVRMQDTYGDVWLLFNSAQCHPRHERGRFELQHVSQYELNILLRNTYIKQKKLHCLIVESITLVKWFLAATQRVGNRD
jgi:hypothetical protein